MTEAKHTWGELTLNYAEMGGYDCVTAAVYLKVGNHHLATVDLNDYGQIHCIDPDDAMKDKAMSDAARLVRGWNLLNRLDEVGVSAEDALLAIKAWKRTKEMITAIESAEVIDFKRPISPSERP